MAGSNDSPDSPKKDTRPGAQSKPPARKVKTFSCRKCGASISLRAPGESLTIVCGTCQSTLDATDPNFRILQTYNENVEKFSPTITLGARAKLFDKTWEHIGYMRRRDEASGYCWTEYLLFNPYYGYRWLTESSGHWSFVTPIKDSPKKHVSISYRESMELDKKRYFLFERGKAVTQYALGEFYWQVRVGDHVFMDDYICPPNMLSNERDDQEINWSLGEYVDPKIIYDAFGVKSFRGLDRQGTGPHQPNPHKTPSKLLGYSWIVFIIFVVMITFGRASSALNQEVMSGGWLSTRKDNSFTSKVFTLVKDKANLKINMSSNVQNSWVYVQGQLVNNDTGLTYDFDQSIEYYWGTDSDGSWTEGSNSADTMLFAVPAGKYYVNLESELPPDQLLPIPVNFSVVRDVPQYNDFFFVFFVLSVLPLWYWYTSYKFESSRWSQSDFSPYGSGIYWSSE